jgi:molybdopterin-guanine dinucleotide biosynthesis protein A
VSESAIVLCGGRSARMGRDKASLPFGGETLLARVLRLVHEVVPDVVLVAREGQELPDGLDAVRDPAEGLGPLAGITAGLAAVSGERVFVAACDMPLLRPALVRRLLELAEGFDACAPVIGGIPVPTCAVYARATAERARQLVAEGRLSARGLLESVRTRWVGEQELRGVDPELASFLDCDTPEAYRAALAAAGLAGPAGLTAARRSS